MGEVLADLADRDPRIVVLTADLKHPTRMCDFEARHPDRFFDFGVAERNMLCAAAGLAASGKVPYVAGYGAFTALLGCQEIRTAIAYPCLPVRILGTHSGIAMGYYGTSHHATEDLAILRAMANLSVVCPADGPAIRKLLTDTVDVPGPVYFRLGRGREKRLYEGREEDITFGRATTARPGRDGVILTNGTTLSTSLEAAAVLAERAGLDVGVLDLHTVKPLDTQAILEAARSTGRVLTVEEHTILGGLGAACAEVLLEGGLTCRFKRHGLKDEYSLIGPPTQLWRHYRLDAEGIAAAFRELLD
jgi:transketolase